MSAEGISSKVRRIAILVTSLDASAGRQLLMAMPTELARQVRRAMTQLGHVDPEEQRQILAEFRMQAISGAATSKHEAVSRTGTSVSTNIDTVETVAAQRGRAGSMSDAVGEQPKLAPFGSGSDRYDEVHVDQRTTSHFGVTQLDAQTLSVLLRGERATVVAVVLSQLEPRLGAELLGKLPKPLQREAIVSYSRIGQIDPDAMNAIHEHLASRIADYHHSQAGENESTSRMQELLSAAAPELRSDWQTTLSQAEPQMAARMGIAPTAAATAPSANLKTNAASKATSPVTAPPVPAARGASMLDLLADNVVTTADLRVANTLATPNQQPTVKQPLAPSNVPASADARDADVDNDRARILPFPSAANPKATPASSAARTIRFEQILDLPAEEIGEILAAADTDVILYALAGASPAFMKRFMAMLDRADGRALQARLKQLRAINLKDVDAAQQRLCELASERRVTSAAA